MPLVRPKGADHMVDFFCNLVYYLLWMPVLITGLITLGWLLFTVVLAMLGGNNKQGSNEFAYYWIGKNETKD